MRRLLFSLPLLGALAAAPMIVPAGRATACSSSERVVSYAEFAPGGVQPAGDFAARLRARMGGAVRPGNRVDSYHILASGDVAEGADWNAASAEGKQADTRLGEARVAALRGLIESLPPELRSPHVSVHVREGRQLFTSAQTAQNPALTEALRGAIVADIRPDLPPPRPGEPVPVC
jgi:hypothetical protein